MVKPKLRPIWDDPRVRRILAQPVGTPIDWSQFTPAEIRRLVAEGVGGSPAFGPVPKLQVEFLDRKES
jgi:hypothetical protein